MDEGFGKKKIKADYIRHSKAQYLTYDKIAMSENPGQKFDHKDQVYPDLSDEGVQFAKERAKEFFKNLDPEKEELFFVSSNEARAIETAAIYRAEAIAGNFKIIKPEQSRSKLSDEHLGGDIRVIDSLSINFKKAWTGNLFNSPETRRPMNYEAMEPSEVKLYKELHDAIDQDNKGSFAANFLAHGDMVKNKLPAFETAEDLYNRNFRNLIKLFKFAEAKNAKTGSEKELRILAFAHENQVLVALNKYFDEHGIHNCEVLSIESGESGEINSSFRGKEIKNISASEK